MQKGIILILLVFLSLGCKKEKVVQSSPTPVKNESNAAEEKGVDILFPEIEEIQNETYANGDLFKLWDIYFKSFVATVSENPLDTRVNFKSMYQLREAKDPDYMDLVTAIEKKMATTKVDELEFDQQVAFYINTYNYTGLRLINKGYVKKNNEIIESIKELSKVLYPYEILIREVVTLHDGIFSMDDIIKKKLKALFLKNKKVTDARFLFALNGGMLGRSFLLNEAYKGEKLDEQLEFASLNAFRLKRIAKLDGRKLYVNRYVKWYKDYMEEAEGSLKNFLTEAGVNPESYDTIKYQDFDWSTNDLATYAGLPIGESGSIITPQTPPNDDTDTRDKPGNNSSTDSNVLGTPCDYLKSDTVEVLGYCSKMISQQLDGFYKYEFEVTSSKLCLFTRKLEDGKSTLGVIGNVTETSEEMTRPQSTTIEVEDVAKLKGDKLRIRKAEGVRTTLEYLKTDKRLMVRQTSVLPGKGYRKFHVQCR